MFNMLQSKLSSLWLGLALPLAYPVVAEVTPYTLGEVNVQAQMKLSDPDALVVQQQISEQGHTNVADAAADLAGVTLTTSGSRGESSVQIRGFDMRETPLFIDGIPVYVPYDGNVDLGRFATSDLAQIDIAKGFSSMVYGANAIGGAINLVSRKPVRQFEGDISGTLIFNDDAQLDGYNSSLNMGTNQQSWYAQLGISYLDNSHFTLSDQFTPTAVQESGRRENSYNRDQKLNVKIGYTPNTTDEYSFNYINQQAKKGSAPYAGSDPSYSVRYWQWPEWDKQSYYMISRTVFGNEQLKIRAYHDIFKNKLKSYDDSDYDSQYRGYAFNSAYDDYTNGLSVEYEINALKNSLFTLVSQYKEDVHRETNDEEPELKFKDRTYSLGVENTTQLSSAWTLVAGLSQNWLKGQTAQNYENGQLGEFAKADESITNAQLGLYLQQSDTQQWHATFARKSRFPTLKDRYSYKMGSAISNPDLAAEVANHYELGLQDIWAEQLVVSSNLFFTDISQLIQSHEIDDGQCGSPPCSQMVNVGQVYRYGVEMNMLFDITDTLLFKSNYAWLNQTNSSSDDRLTETPKHAGFISLAWDISDTLDLLLTERIESKRYSDTSGSRIAGGFATTDIRVAYVNSNATQIALKVGNLFDKLYAYQEGWPQPGRTLEFSASQKF